MRDGLVCQVSKSSNRPFHFVRSRDSASIARKMVSNPKEALTMFSLRRGKMLNRP